MKTLIEFIKESKEIKMSNDDIKNGIYKELSKSQYKIVIKSSSIDNLLGDVNKERYGRNYDELISLLEKDDSFTKNPDRIIQASCWEGGTKWVDSTKYNQATLVDASNNTDYKWYFCIYGTNVKVWAYRPQRMNNSQVLEIIKEFEV